MAFPNRLLEDIRARTGLADAIARKVKLTRRGREYVGLCPFHHEKSPSFTVNEEKGFYHCFGCGAHGDVISFVMNTAGLSFPEAVERLAGDAGLEIPVETPEARAQAKRQAQYGDRCRRQADAQRALYRAGKQKGDGDNGDKTGIRCHGVQSAASFSLRFW